jgi:hypothetical protein
VADLAAVVLVLVFVEVVLVVDEAAGAAALLVVFVLSFVVLVVLVVLVFELVVDAAGVWAITRLAESNEPRTNTRVFFMVTLKLLSLALQAAPSGTANCDTTSCRQPSRWSRAGINLRRRSGYLPGFAGWFAITSFEILV